MKALGDKSGRGIALDAQPAGRASTPRRSRSTICACARRCRWRSTAGAAPGLSQNIALAQVGGVLRPGSPFATPEAELVKLPGFSKDIKASRAEAKKLLAEAGVPNLKFKLHNRNVAMPYTPVGVFLIDQWRQIGVDGEAQAARDRLYLAHHERRQPSTSRSTSQLFMDDPNLAVAKYLSRRPLAGQPLALEGPRARRALRQAVARTRPGEAQGADPRVREARCSSRPTAAAPLVAPHHATTRRSRAGRSRPATTSGQDLADVWLEHSS